MVTPLLAVMITVSPVDALTSDIEGVESDVTLSVEDEPRSDAARRSGATGAEGAVVSMTTDVGVPALAVLPA